MTKPLLHSLQIDSLSNELLAEFNPDRLRQGFATMLRHYRRLSINYNFGTKFIWRGRKCDPDGKTNLSELWHPKPHSAKANRLNVAKNPVLYASNHKGAVFDELELEEGEHIQLMSFRMKPGTSIIATFVGEFAHIYRTGMSMISPEIGKRVNDLFETLPWDAGRSLIHMDAFLASVLRDPKAAQQDYAHSQALAHNLFKKADAIYYPSVKSENGLNIAITKNAASRVLEPIGGSVVKITHKNIYGIHDFEIIKINDGADDRGRLHWIDPDAKAILKIRTDGPPPGWRELM